MEPPIPSWDNSACWTPLKWGENFSCFQSSAIKGEKSPSQDSKVLNPSPEFTIEFSAFLGMLQWKEKENPMSRAQSKTTLHPRHTKPIHHPQCCSPKENLPAQAWADTLTASRGSCCLMIEASIHLDIHFILFSRFSFPFFWLKLCSP